MKKEPKEVGLHESYTKNPIQTDQSHKDNVGYPHTRRGFIKASALAAMNIALGAKMVYANNFPLDLIPAGLTNSDAAFELPGKDSRLVVLNDKPINAETPPFLLDDELTPNSLFFVRNNGIPPVNIDVAKWTLTIEGESAQQKKTYTLSELKSKFQHYTYNLTLECG
ncbi:MAG: molybdopterin-dependent oxidoreductase, partial [Bacteroidota bacterium]